MQQDSFDTVAPVFYSVGDIQRLLGIGQNSAYILINSKGLPAIYEGIHIIPLSRPIIVKTG